jgi:hypothetical protein
VKEEIPLYDAPPPHSQRELFRSLSVEEPPRPQAIYFNRLLSLDTRVSCALVYWTTRGNTDILNQCSKWIDESSYQEDFANSDPMKKPKVELSSRYLVWVQLLWHSEKKSEVVQDEAAYYSHNDPARQFREMELKSLATKELVNEDDLNDGDFSDGSEGSESDEESEGDGDDDDTSRADSTARIPHPQDSFRRVPIKPKHKRVYRDMLADKYAMALLHLSATDYIDDTVAPTDEFNLYEDSQKVCQRYDLVPLSSFLFTDISLVACSKYIHDELPSHINQLLSFALEGPSSEESFRYSHPYQIISSLLQQDTSIGLAETIRQEAPLSTIQYLLTRSLSLREGVVDNIFRSNAISLLAHLFGGLEMYYFHPSLSPMHQHTVPLTEKYRQARSLTCHDQDQQEKEKTTASSPKTLSSIKLYRQCKGQISDLIEHICETIYKTRREDLLPCGDTGRCYLSRIVRLLTIFADLDDISVWLIASFPRSCPSSSHLI